MIQGKFVSVTFAAEQLGCTTGRVRQLLLAGEIAGQKLTPRAWGVEFSSLQKALKTTHTTGRPRVSKNIQK